MARRLGPGGESEAPLFPTLQHGRLTGRTPLPQANVHVMLQRRALAAASGPGSARTTLRGFMTDAMTLDEVERIAY
jgi:hypothetical protein